MMIDRSRTRAGLSALPDNAPFRVQLISAEVPPEQRWTAFYYWLMGLIAGSVLVMMALGLLARHGVPVPTLGYLDTLTVLLGAKAVVLLLGRARWSR